MSSISSVVENNYYPELTNTISKLSPQQVDEIKTEENIIHNKSDTPPTPISKPPQLLSDSKMPYINKAINHTDEVGIDISIGSNIAATDNNMSEQPYFAKIDLPEGTSRTISLDGNSKIHYDKLGNISVYSFASDTTRTYTSDNGEWQESKGDNIPSNSSSVYACFSNTQTTGSNSNNTYMLYGDDITINAGDGNNIFILAEDVNNIKINSKDGDNLVKASTVYNSEIKLGNGNNKIFAEKMYKGTVSAENGNNFFQSTLVNGTDINLGKGNNAFRAYYFCSDASLVVGDGKNNIDVQCFGNSHDHTSLHCAKSSASMSIGNGNNDIYIFQISNSSNFTIGDGDNAIYLNTTSGNSKVQIGNGDNELKTRHILDNTKINIGDGNNIFKASCLDDNAKVCFGDGNNKFHLYPISDESLSAFFTESDSEGAWLLSDASQIPFGTFCDEVNSDFIGKKQLPPSSSAASNNLENLFIKNNASVSFGNGNNNFFFYALTSTDQTAHALNDEFNAIMSILDNTTRAAPKEPDRLQNNPAEENLLEPSKNHSEKTLKKSGFDTGSTFYQMKLLLPTSIL